MKSFKFIAKTGKKIFQVCFLVFYLAFFFQPLYVHAIGTYDPSEDDLPAKCKAKNGSCVPKACDGGVWNGKVSSTNCNDGVTHACPGDPKGWEAPLICGVPGAKAGNQEYFCCPSGSATPTTPSTADTTKAPASPPGGLKQLACESTGNCTITDLVQKAINFANFLMGLSGALFLVVFVYGGGLYVMAFGRAEYVQKAFKSMKTAAMGIIFIMAAWTLVWYVAGALGYTSAETQINTATTKAATDATSAASANSAGTAGGTVSK